MKKLFVIVSLIFVAMTANAQLYLGGSFNFGIGSDKNNNGVKLNTVTQFGLNPEVGYYITDRFDIGLAVGIGTTSNENHVAKTKTTGSNWNFTPYARYAFLQFGNFEVIARGSIGIGGNTIKNAAGNKITTTSFGISVAPVLSYNLNNHIALFTNLNFAGFGINTSKVKDGGSDVQFGLGINADDVATLGDIEVGFIYKF